MKKNKLLFLLLAINIIYTSSILNAQITIPVQRDTIKVKFEKSIVYFPIEGIANVTTSDTSVIISLNSDIFLSDLNQKLLKILKDKYEKPIDCGKSVVVYNAHLFNRENNLLLKLDIRPKYKQCEFPYISTNHRGNATFKIMPYIENMKIGIKAILIDHDLGIFMDYFTKSKTILLTEENIPGSFSRHNFELKSFKSNMINDNVIFNSTVLGDFTAEELGRLIKLYGKNKKDD